MKSSAGRTNKGFTLVEVLIAMLILMMGCLAIAQVAVTVMDTNMGNLLRDEAVRIADARVSGQLTDTLNITHAGLANQSRAQLRAMAGQSLPITVTGTSRGIRRNYTVVWTVTPLNAVPPAAERADPFRVEVWVGWSYKGGNAVGLAPTGQAYQHSVSTIITR